MFSEKKEIKFLNLYPPQPSLENREGAVRNKNPDL
jgi:hypothetical protein